MNKSTMSVPSNIRRSRGPRRIECEDLSYSRIGRWYGRPGFKLSEVILLWQPARINGT